MQRFENTLFIGLEPDSQPQNTLVKADIDSPRLLYEPRPQIK